MAGRRKKETMDPETRLKKNVKLKFNHIYNIKGTDKTLVIRKLFLGFEEFYRCDITEYDSNGWSYKVHANEPFTLKEICKMLDIDYNNVIRPEEGLI